MWELLEVGEQAETRTFFLGGGMNAVAEVVDVFNFAEVAEKNKDVTKAV